MNPNALRFVCNPFNHEPLHFENQARGEVLVGKESGTIFPIRDGIPVLMNSSNLSNANEKSMRFYDVPAPFYEFTQSFYYRMKGGEEKVRTEYLRYAGVREGDRVLEVSMGNSVNIKFLPRNTEYFGIDISWGQLKICRQNMSRYNLNIEIFQAEAEHLPFCDEVFDVVFNVGSINYFEDKKKAIDEMLRVAKPGARLMIADETEKAARAHNKMPIYRRFFNSSKAPVKPPEDLLPRNVVGVNLTEIRDGSYFCLQFRKSY